jgi:hypothetical protein
MRRVAIAGTVGMLFVTPTGAQMPGPFEHMAHIVCADPSVAYELLTVFERDAQLGEKLLAHLATRDVCERATFSGKPVADVKALGTSTQREGHVFEVEVLKGDVLKGRTRAFLLLYVLRNNES